MTILRHSRLPATALGRFCRDEGASMTIEALFVLPMLIWAYIATFQFFDAYREMTVNLRAAYTVADTISREMDGIETAYVDGLNDVFDYLTHSNDPTWIRVTSVGWDVPNDRYKVKWSIATKSQTVYDDMTINDEADRLPILALGDTVILVETNMEYEPAFQVLVDGVNVGLEDLWYRNFVVTRPRFASCVPLDNSGC